MPTVHIHLPKKSRTKDAGSFEVFKFNLDTGRKMGSAGRFDSFEKALAFVKAHGGVEEGPEPGWEWSGEGNGAWYKIKKI